MQVTKHTSEGIHPGCEPHGRRDQKSETRVSVVPERGLMPFRKIFENVRAITFTIKVTLNLFHC